MGRDFIRQYVVHTHLREEILYRLHNSKYGSHPGIAKKADFYRKHFLTHYEKNCSSCFQTKPVEHATLKPPLLSSATDKHFPGESFKLMSLENCRNPEDTLTF